MANGRFAALYSRDFRLFFIGQVISFSGTWMQSTAQGWLVYSMTKSPFYLGIVSAMSSLPVLMLSLVGGVFADRFEKRGVLIATQALLIIPALLIGLLTNLGIIRVWHVMVLVAVAGTINAFDLPARQSFLIEMVERGSLLNAVALNSAAFNAGRIIGPFLAGMTIAYVGLPACFYLNALSFLPVVGALYVMRARSSVRAGRVDLKGEFMEGLRFVVSEPDIRGIMLIVVAFSLLGIPFITLLPIYAGEILRVGPKGLGFLAASAGLGAFLSAVGLAFKGDVKNKRRLMAVSSISFPIGLIVFSRSEVFSLSLAMLFVCGLSLVTYLALANSTIQIKSPDELRGRVMSVYTMLFLGLAPIGNSVVGLAAQTFGTENTLMGSSVLCLLVSLFLLRGRR